MKKMTYDEYENFCIQSPDEFWNEFDYGVDMENTAELKYDFDFDFPYGISAVDEDADVVAKISTDVMNAIMEGRMTFQRAFMTGEMTAKGNFKTLRMLDQVFHFGE